MSISAYSTHGRITTLLNCAIADLEGILPEYEPTGDRKHPAWQTLADLKQMVTALETDAVLFSWCIEDVQCVRKDLDDKQSRQVLEHCFDCHEATEGINWDVIEANADQLFPVERRIDYDRYYSLPKMRCNIQREIAYRGKLPEVR